MGSLVLWVFSCLIDLCQCWTAGNSNLLSQSCCKTTKDAQAVFKLMCKYNLVCMDSLGLMTFYTSLLCTGKLMCSR